jgi:hypothetical protein
MNNNVTEITTDLPDHVITNVRHCVSSEQTNQSLIGFIQEWEKAGYGSDCENYDLIVGV